MPIHLHTERYHAPDATPEGRRTAECGMVLPENWTRVGRDQLRTASDVSRREDVASWDETGHELRLWLSRLCPSCFPYSRDPEFIRTVMSET